MSLPEIRPAETRDAQAHDAQALSALGRETFLDTFVTGFALPYSEADIAAFLKGFTPEAFARMIADPDMRVWVTTVDGAAVAYATAGPNTLPHPEAQTGERELKRFYIRRDWQGAGLAAPLMDTAMAWLAPTGAERVWLSVWSGNLRAQRFYARRGFVHVGDHLYAVGETRDHDFIYRRG